MDTEVDLVLTAWLLLLKHVGLVLVVEELDDGHPRVAVVDIVTEARGVDDSQTDCRPEKKPLAITVELNASSCIRTLEEFLLQLSLGNFNLDSLVDLLLVSAFVVGIVLDGGRKESVDKGGLSKARLSSNLRVRALAIPRLESLTQRQQSFSMMQTCQTHTIIVKLAPRLATILCRWLGKLAMPIGEALSAGAGAILTDTGG